MSATARVRGVGRPRRLAVDLPAALNLVGAIAKYLSLTTVVPAAVAVGYGESPWPFLVAGAITGSGGWALERGTSGDHSIGAREGFLVVSLTWLVAALIGALPYLLSGESQVDRPLDAYFEAMSGFTTTGASVLTDVEGVSRSLLLWRQFTQWLGGIGIVVLALAVLPRLRVGGRQLLESELPGPEIESLSTRIRDTARRLWFLYAGLTAALIAALVLFDVTGIDDEMTVFDAFAHAFSTIPTGGFGTRATSLQDFGAATQWTLTLFMFLAGANFALMYRAFVRRHPRVFARDEEFRLYVALLAVGTLIVGVQLWAEGIATGEAAVRHAAFQAVSMMTTTGFASVDFNVWPVLASMTLVGLMFVGGSAGSTAGSVKVVRHLLLGKILRRELDQTVHPELVTPVRLNRAVVDERTLRAASSFILLYIGIFVVGAALLAMDAARTGLDLSVLDAVAASATTLGNVGPAFGVAGPFGSFAPFSDVSTGIMIVLMWLGRLEVIPIVVLFTRHYWRNA
ncbi:MAG: TrkH family potassium uptake protein [Actinobacteria bacterium]|nr:TrkH family potassium uptake protein [Actinomycetota bacterium]